MNYYTVYDNKTENVIVFGDAKQCAQYLGIQVSSFYYAISRQKRRKIEGQYTIVIEEKTETD